jgi:HAD superfamily hydrolase (TIGR01450 family)
MYSLWLGLSSIKRETNFNIDCLLINNADCLYASDMMNQFVNSDLKNMIACKKNVFIEESMKVSINDNGSLSNIAKAIKPEQSWGISIDLYKYDANAVKKLYKIIDDYITLKKDVKQWTEVAFPELFKFISVIPFDTATSKWVEVDNSEDLLLADSMFSKFDYRSKKAYILDLDGTVYVGAHPISESINFINKFEKEFDFYFLTNNTSKLPRDYAEKLKLMGVNYVDENKIITPLKSMIDYIRDKKFNSIYLVANENVANFVKKSLPLVSFNFDVKNNQGVALTYDTELTYAKLRDMAIILNNDARTEYIATHSDNFCPSEKGSIPDIGAMIALMQKTTNREPQIIFGKPSTRLIDDQIKKYGREKLAIVGDRLYTDKKLADDANIDFICVLSGETKRIDLVKIDSKYPAIVVKTLADIEKIT